VEIFFETRDFFFKKTTKLLHLLKKVNNPSFEKKGREGLIVIRFWSIVIPTIRKVLKKSEKESLSFIEQIIEIFM